MSKKILVVDDDTYSRGSIQETLKRKGYEVHGVGNGADALRELENGDFELIISDMKMPGMSGIELLDEVRRRDADIPFLLITAFGDIDLAVAAMKKGAQDFIQKTTSLIDELEITVERLLEYRTLLTENRQLKTALQKQWNFIGSGGKLDEIRALVQNVAESKSSVLVTGESGTGKELIARSIHYQSPRRNGPFIKINCAALPDGLIESELFGHEKGAFTGALRKKLGKFELASGGTLLLDEIGEMPAMVQAKLLRVLQEHEIDKVGGDLPVGVDVRVVATTNRGLEEDILTGRFREDLFYRLNVFQIHLPALRERKQDIDKLVEHFIKKYNDENGFSVEGLDKNCIDMLMDYDWPGNIRELENCMERAVVLTKSGLVLPNALAIGTHRECRGKETATINAGTTIAEIEKGLILTTLDHCSQNRTKAAEMLGISIRTLRNKLKEYGVSKS